MIDNFLKLHATYENKALRILLKEFRKMSAKISFDALTKENAEAIIPFAPVAVCVTLAYNELLALPLA